MNPAATNPAQEAINAISAYEKEENAKSDTVAEKIKAFVSSPGYGDLISVHNNGQIDVQLENMTVASSKTEACKKLSALITQISETRLKTAAGLLETAIFKTSFEKFNNDIDFTSLQKFINLTNEQERADIITKFLQSIPNDSYRAVTKISIHFAKFGFNNYQVRASLILYFANLHGDVVATYFKNYRLEGKEISAIAKILASLTVENTIKHPQFIEGYEQFILNNDLDDRSRFEVARKMAEFESDYRPALVKRIREFRIMQEKDRFEIACIAAKYRGLAANIENFQLSEEHRIDIAEIVAKNHPDLLIKFFPNFNLNSEEACFQLAKTIAQQNCKLISENIALFNLSEEHSFVIAQLIAAKEEEETSLGKNLSSFNITDKQHLLVVIDLLLSNSEERSALCEHINLLNLSKEEELKIIHTIIEHHGADGIADNIRVFQLTDDEIISIAYEIFNEQPLALIENIGEFNLSQKDQLHFAWETARFNSDLLSENIGQFNALPDEARLALAKYSASKGDITVLMNWGAYNLDAKEEIVFTILRIQPEFSNEIFQHFFMDVDPIEGEDFEDIKKLVEESQSSDVKVWWNSFKIVVANIQDSQMKLCADYAKLILKLENPNLRYLLSELLWKYKLPEPLSDGKDHTKLLNLIVQPLTRIASLSELETSKIWSVLGSKEYRENGKREKAMKGLFSLLECDTFKPAEKKTLLNHIFDNNEKIPAYNALHMLAAIIDTDNAMMLMVSDTEHLTKEQNEKSTKAGNETAGLRQPINFTSTLQAIFKKAIDLESSDDFEKKYDASFGKARNPIALLAYAANLTNDISGEKTLPDLKKFTVSVLNGTYKNLRYENPKNSHLEIALKGQQYLQKNWPLGASCTIGELYKKVTEEGCKTAAGLAQSTMKMEADEKEDTSIKTLKQKVCHDKHIDPNFYKFFDACLQGKKQIKQALKECNDALGKEITSLNGATNTAKYDPSNMKTLRFFQLKLESALISLLDAMPNKKIEQINKIIASVKKMYGTNAQFAQDLEDLKKQLAASANVSQEKDFDHYIIEDTDHWEDMLLCGTEVIGSCQRIGGQVYHNKCLLAYMIDGKNRAIVIKEPKTGKIVARCIMRLLWDDNAKRPVLFQERLYHNPGLSERAIKAIDFMFAERARQFKIPLARSGEGEFKQYPNDLISQGSVAAFEYVDASKIGITEGGFTIPSKDIELIHD